MQTAARPIGRLGRSAETAHVDWLHRRRRQGIQSQRMHDALTVYFNGEAITLTLIALVEMAIGVGLYLRTGPQLQRLEAQLRVDEAAFHSAESARMARVQRNFVIIEYAELAIILTAALVAVFMKQRTGAVGVALGLLVHAAVLLTFDVLAERRGADYLAMVVSPRSSGR
jgi:hypothetical protein